MRKDAFALVVAALTVVGARSALGGVDGGNPRAAHLYNMAFSYRILVPTGMSVERLGADNSVRVEGPLTYRDEGHFIIASRVPVLSTGEFVCKEQEVPGAPVRIYWVGTDCNHAYFKLRFVELAKVVLAVEFPTFSKEVRP